MCQVSGGALQQCLAFMKLPGVVARNGGDGARKSSLKKPSGNPATLPNLLLRASHAEDEEGGLDISRLVVNPERIAKEDNLAGEGGDIGRDDFEVLGLLGEGGFGEVKLVRCFRNQQLYAMKALEKAAVEERRYGGDAHASARAQAERDIGVMSRQWRCPFILELCAAFQTSEKLYYVFEYCPNGDLHDRLVAQELGRFAEADARFYAAEACLALEHLHAHGTIHRDVKLENLLLASDGHLKLADFGIAKMNLSAEGARASYTFGAGHSKVFYPPEFQRGELYGKDLDCWQLGVATHCMLAGSLPHTDDCCCLTRLPQGTSKAAANLCTMLLKEERTQRLGFPEGASQIRSHDFFQGLDWEMVRSRELTPPSLGTMSSERSRGGDVRPTVKSKGAFFWLQNFSFVGSMFERGNVGH